MDGQGKLGESDISDSTCHLSIQFFLAWLNTQLSATPASSLACLFCTHVLQQRFLVLNSATSNLRVTSFCPDLDPLHCQSFRMFQVVVENLLTRMPPTTKSASLGFITWQAKYRHTNYHEVSVICKLKGSHEHSLAAYTYQTVKRDGVVVLILTSLQTSNQSSGNARRQSANWKLLIWGGRLSVWICLETRGLQKQLNAQDAVFAAFRHLADTSAISWTMRDWSAHFRSHFKCWVLRLFANACTSVLQKRWHARLPASPRAAWSSSGRLSSRNFATQTPSTWACDLRSVPSVSTQLLQTGSLF